MLSDEVASRVLGELHRLTKHLDEQSQQVINTSGVVKQATEKIKKNMDDAVSSSKAAVYQAQIESAIHFENELAGVAAKTFNKVADSVAIKAATKWVLAGVALAGVLTVTAGAAGYAKGKDAGAAEGYARARDEVAAASWSSTQEGMLAHQLSEVQQISRLAKCSGQGWKIEKRDGEIWCFPYPAADGGTYGWRVP